MTERKHTHLRVVRHLNGKPEPFKPTDKAGRPYWWRISVCEGDANDGRRKGCGSWYSEAAYERWPAHPAIGEVNTGEAAVDAEV